MRRLDHRQIIIEYKNGLSQNQIAKKHDTTQPVISKLLRRCGISKGRPRKYNIINIFKKWDEFSSYILGFFLADGHITKKDDNQRGRRYKIIINLQGRDNQHLELMGRRFCDSLKIKITKKTRILASGLPKEYHNARLTIYSTDVVDSLLKIGWDDFKNRISWEPFLSIPKTQFRHVLRGYFDGNGGFYLNEQVPCAYVLGHRPFLQWWQTNFNSLNLGGFITDKKSISCLRYNGRIQTAKIADYLYSESAISLHRKKALATAAIEL